MRTTAADGTSVHSSGAEGNGNGAGMHAGTEQFRHPMSLEEVYVHKTVLQYMVCLLSGQ